MAVATFSGACCLRGRGVALLSMVVALLGLAACTRGEIYWENCLSPADHPTMNQGDLYNLCVDDHVFEDVNFAWKFTKGEVKNSEFLNCGFTNKRYAPNNFTEANWVNVLFDGCFFGSIVPEEDEMVFDRMTMNNVEFRNTIFDHTVKLRFDNFEMNNVTFNNCTFKGDTNFSLGQVNRMMISDSSMTRSLEAPTPSGDDSFTFHLVTLRDVSSVGNNFVAPLRFEGVNAADISFNRTAINEFHCHSPADPKTNAVQHLTRFNDSAFQQVQFHDQVYCDRTSWRGFFMGNVTFYHHAFFADSDIMDLYWDGVHSTNKTGDCRQLNMSNSYIDRRVLANTTVDCEANFYNTKFETVYVKNFVATRPDFENAMFINQEFIDGVCCSNACVSLKCLCNVTDTSGNCPAADRSVNVSAPEPLLCFPGDGALTREGGAVVTMEELAVRERVAVGGGEHSDVFFFGHRDAEVTASYVTISHSAGDKALRLSPTHYLYVNGELATARKVRAGDRLRRGADGRDDVVVRDVAMTEGRGVYAPASLHGDLVVDGVVVSSYTSAVHPSMAHHLLLPLRLLYRSGLGRAMARVTALHRHSWEPAARWLGIPRGPDVVVA